MSLHNLKVNVYFFISCPTFGPLFHPVIDTAMIICVTLPQKENIQFELLWIKEALELQQNICVKGFSLVKENAAVKQRHIYSRQLQGHDTTFQYNIINNFIENIYKSKNWYLFLSIIFVFLQLDTLEIMRQIPTMENVPEQCMFVYNIAGWISWNMSRSYLVLLLVNNNNTIKIIPFIWIKIQLNI